MHIPEIVLKSGHKMPLLGLGTWRLVGKRCTDAVKTALELGYRHIDTAHVYENHKDIHQAIKDFDRSSLFLTSKLALTQVHDKHIKESIEKACSLAMNELGVDYLDLYLIHWPDHTRPMQEMLNVMQELREQKKIRSMGVSNCTIHHLQDALDAGIALDVNQVEFHPYLNQQELLAFCRRHKIHLTSYRSLGKGAILEEPLFSKIGGRHHKKTAQVVLRWLVQQEISVIPMSSSKEHLKENLEIFHFSLSEKEEEEIAKLNRGHRYCDTDWAEFNY